MFIWLFMLITQYTLFKYTQAGNILIIHKSNAYQIDSSTAKNIGSLLQIFSVIYISIRNVIIITGHGKL